MSNIVLNDQSLDAFLLKSESRQRCLFSPLLFKIELKVPLRAIRQPKEIKCNPDWKEKI